jgi:hypothetical protein
MPRVDLTTFKTESRELDLAKPLELFSRALSLDISLWTQRYGLR